MTEPAPIVSHGDGMRAAEYALGVLSGRARADFALRMQQEPALAAAVRQWDEHFTQMTEEIAPVTPPAHVKAALEERLFVGLSQQQTPSLWNSLWLWRGLAVASLATAIAVGAWTLQRPAGETASALVAQVAGDAEAVKLVAYYDETKGELRLNRTQGTAAVGRSFELWLIAGADAPVSLGVLSPDAIGKVVIPAQLRSKIRGGVLAISDEPQGGSPTGAPTGAVLATGALTSV